MPPKAKLHKEKGKLKSLPKVQPSSEPQPSTSDADLQSQFEVELVWCIQQLQLALSSGKLSQKQMQDQTKTLNTLISNSTPVIRKRQLMRLTFGDYRAKMAEEERKYSKINSKIVLAPGVPSKKSMFVKKAPFLSSGKDFKFNFNVNPEQGNANGECNTELTTAEVTANEMSKLNIEEAKAESTTNNEEFHFAPSDNSFRFNFTESENNQ